jgi:molybdate transport system substrate-binding protein
MAPVYEMRGQIRVNMLLAAIGLPLAVLAALAPRTCEAEALKVLSAGACESFVSSIAAEFEKRRGQPVSIQEGTIGQLVQRINGGEPFDVALLTPAGLERIPGRYVSASRVALVRVGIAVAVRENAPRPDIASVESFKRALLQARSIAYVDPAAGGTSGIYFSHLLEQLGIADAVRAKQVMVPGGAVAQRIASGQAEIGIQMTSEMLGVKGVTVIGPLPEPIQTYTVYDGVIGASASDPAAARALLELLASPEEADQLKAAGLERPPSP